MESNKKQILNTNSTSQKKPNIILDIDQTLIDAVYFGKENIDKDEDDEYYDFLKNKEKALKFDYENFDDYYVIFFRPHLQTFLDYIFENFNVSIWTAASKDYALFIIENIICRNDPKRKLDYTFFSYHCSLSKKFKKGTKDLSMMWDFYKDPNFSESNTFILDDYDEVYNTQPNNCIFVDPPFHFKTKGSEKDNFLLNLIPKLKKIKKNIEKGKKNFLNV